jgi:hypothetical protein
MIKEFKECAHKEAVDNKQLFDLAADCESNSINNGRSAAINKAFIGEEQTTNHEIEDSDELRSHNDTSFFGQDFRKEIDAQEMPDEDDTGTRIDMSLN